MAGDGQQAQTFCDEATGLIDQLTDDALARRLESARLAGSVHVPIAPRRRNETDDSPRGRRRWLAARFARRRRRRVDQ
jgi:hypothetical protein